MCNIQYLIYLGMGGFHGGSALKNLSANTGDMGSIPELRRSPREGNGN